MTATTIDDGPRPAARVRSLSLPRPRPELLALLVAAAVLNLWALTRNGYANEYYAGAVRSMASSWHAFLYGSLDAGGVMTVDKPPLALWVQALSARVFGFHSLSLLVPQALMGVATVGLVYDLVRRRWGRVGGFVAGACLALTPITVAISRHNNPDALLILCIVFALWALVRALEDGRTRWIVWAGVGVGLGFEAKMGAALLVVPGIAAAWLWVAPRGRMAAARALALGGAAMVAVGGAWPLLMALTPASSRPWISGTSDNSIWSLIVGYNGLGRLDGQAGGPGGMMGGGGGNSLFGGSPGLVRLVGSSLGGQAGWLVGLALVGGAGLLVASRLRRSPRTGWLIAIGGAFLTIAVAFSAAKGIFHPYYMSELAPFTAALVGATAGHVAARGAHWRYIGAAAIAGGVISELAVLHSTGTLGWVAPLLVIAGVACAGALIAAPSRWRRAALATALATLTLAPATWAVQTLGHATNGTFPSGGSATAEFGGGGSGPGGRGGFRGAGNGGPPNGAFVPGGAAPGGTTGGGGTGVVPGGGTTGGGTTGVVPGGGTTGGGTTGVVPGGGTSGGTAGRLGGAPGGFAGRGGGGMFGGDSAALQEVVAYAKAHGGGTIGVSSQSTAASAILTSGADVAGLGGFSGRESDISVSWLADQVAAGKLRWIYTGGEAQGGGMRNDGRTGATTAMAAVASTCKPVSSVDGLYDCSGSAAALRAAA